MGWKKTNEIQRLGCSVCGEAGDVILEERQKIGQLLIMSTAFKVHAQVYV